MDTHESFEILKKVPWKITKKQFESYAEVIAYDLIKERREYFNEISEEEKMGLNSFDYAEKTLEEDYPGFSSVNPKTIINSGFNFDLWIENDGDFWNRYIVPTNNALQKMGYQDIYIKGADLIAAYNAGLLPEKIEDKVEPDIEINKVPGNFEPGPFGRPNADKTPEEIRHIWSIASMRKTNANRNEVDQARYDIFVQYNTREDLEDILDLSVSEINKKMRNWALYTQEARRTHQRLNNGVDPESQWFGLVNCNLVSKAQINIDDLDDFFKEIKYSRKSGFGDNYESLTLKRNILNTVMAVDTDIDYSDLSFDIKTIDGSAGGLFHPLENTITIDNNTTKTVAHEIGHYLDQKFKKEFKANSYFLSESVSDDFSLKNLLPEEERWVRRYLQFVDDLEKVASSRGTYMASRIEVFARFISYFVKWANDIAGNRSSDLYWNWDDKFTPNHCRRFVRLLQERNYIEKIRKQSSSKLMTKKASFEQPESLGEDIIGRPIPKWNGAIVLHATDSNSAKDIAENGYKAWSDGYYGKAVSFSTDIDYIRQFGGDEYFDEDGDLEYDKYPKVITKAKISDDARILNQNDPDDWDTYISITGTSGGDVSDKLMAAGYDGLYDPGAGDLFIFNTDVVKFVGLLDEKKEARKKSWYKKATSDLNSDEISEIIEKSNLDGMCGNCGSAAIAINEFFFKGRGQYVAAMITSPEKHRGYAHIAVLYDDVLYDAEGITVPNDLMDWAFGIHEDTEDIDAELVVITKEEALEGTRNSLSPDYFIEKLKNN